MQNLVFQSGCAFITVSFLIIGLCVCYKVFEFAYSRHEGFRALIDFVVGTANYKK